MAFARSSFHLSAWLHRFFFFFFSKPGPRFPDRPTTEAAKGLSPFPLILFQSGFLPLFFVMPVYPKMAQILPGIHPSFHASLFFPFAFSLPFGDVVPALFFMVFGTNLVPSLMIMAPALLLRFFPSPSSCIVHFFLGPGWPACRGSPLILRVL